MALDLTALNDALQELLKFRRLNAFRADVIVPEHDGLRLRARTLTARRYVLVDFELDSDIPALVRNMSEALEKAIRLLSPEWHDKFDAESGRHK